VEQQDGQQPSLGRPGDAVGEQWSKDAECHVLTVRESSAFDAKFLAPGPVRQCAPPAAVHPPILRRAPVPWTGSGSSVRSPCAG